MLCSWLSVHWKILSESHTMSLPDLSSKVEDGKCHTFSLNDHTLSGLADPQRSRGHFCSNQRFLISLHWNYYYYFFINGMHSNSLRVHFYTFYTVSAHAHFLFIYFFLYFALFFNSFSNLPNMWRDEMEAPTTWSVSTSVSQLCMCLHLTSAKSPSCTPVHFTSTQLPPRPPPRPPLHVFLPCCRGNSSLNWAPAASWQQLSHQVQ